MERTQHTPEPWKLGELSEFGGYDCMTHGIKAGPVTLDAADYGQKKCGLLALDMHTRIMADARRIVACVNACAGIPTEAIESGVIQEMRAALEAAINIHKNILTDSQLDTRTRCGVIVRDFSHHVRAVLLKLKG